MKESISPPLESELAYGRNDVIPVLDFIFKSPEPLFSLTSILLETT
jgi:hypothetical protein